MLKNIFFLVVTTVFASTVASAADWVLIHAGKLMAIPGKEQAADQSIVIRNGRIQRIESGYIDGSSLALSGDDRLVTHDLREYHVLPGLIDSHVHITDELDDKSKIRRVEMSDPDTAMFAARNARTTLEAGFTTVQDLGGRGGDAVFALRDAIEQSYVPGPRIVAAGDVVSPTGGHGQRHGYRDEVFSIVNHSGVCDGVDECRRTVRNQVRRGADVIKFVSTGGVLSETDAGTGQQFFNDEVHAIVDTAHALGRRVTAHAHGTDGINAALRAGVDSIEHGTFANKESYRLFRKTGAYLVPTLLAGQAVTEIANSPHSFFVGPVRDKALKVGPKLIESTRNAHREGVKIAFGTDSYVSNHGQNAREFVLLVEAGLTAEEAIVTATVHAMNNLDMADEIGTIEPGKYADIIAVASDPTEDIRELLDVDFVMKGGVVYKDKRAPTRVH